jgi:MFS family permease
MVSQPKKARESAFLTLCVLGFFAILSSTMSKSTPVLKPFASSLGTPTDLLGFVASASTIPGVLVSLPAATLSDIFGRRKFLLMAGFVFASAPFLYLLITVWWQLLLVRFYHGFATAIFVPVAEASIAELFPTKRGERLSLFTSVTYVGRFIAPTLSGYILLITAKNFHILYSAVAVAGVTALIMALAFLAERKQPEIIEHRSARETIEKMFSGWGKIGRNREVLIVSFVQACQYYAYGTADFFLGGYLQDVARLNSLLIGIISTSIIGIAIFARPYMGRVSDKIGRRVPIILGCIVSSLPFLVVPFVTDFWILLLLFVVYGVGFATVTASTPALICELMPKELIGTSMGFLDTVMDVGQTLGPIFSGFVLATYLQYFGVFPLLTFVLLVSCAIFAVSGVAKTERDTNA